MKSLLLILLLLPVTISAQPVDTPWYWQASFDYDAGRLYHVWGDLNGDGVPNPVDVVLLANCVYKNVGCRNGQPAPSPIPRGTTGFVTEKLK